MYLTKYFKGDWLHQDPMEILGIVDLPNKVLQHMLSNIYAFLLDSIIICAVIALMYDAVKVILNASDTPKVKEIIKHAMYVMVIGAVAIGLSHTFTAIVNLLITTFYG